MGRPATLCDPGCNRTYVQAVTACTPGCTRMWPRCATPSFSPDGSRLAFCMAVGGGVEVRYLVITHRGRWAAASRGPWAAAPRSSSCRTKPEPNPNPNPNPNP
eukprot:scaffold51376_cov62-Phaeocystis_antarctica.AAC.9